MTKTQEACTITHIKEKAFGTDLLELHMLLSLQEINAKLHIEVRTDEIVIHT